MQVPPKIKVVLYMRYSSDEQTELSIEYQDKILTKYSDEHEYEIVGKYIERAHTGTNDKRPELKRLLRDARNHPAWKKIIVYKLNRYFRNTGDAIMFERELNSLGIELESSMEPYYGDLMGRFSRNMTYVMDEYYSANISVHTFDSLKVNAEKCKHCGGKPPLGYKVVASRLEIDEHEAEAVRKTFEMVKLGYRYKDIAKYLNDAGYRTRKGKLFTKNSFDSILNQRKYTGTFTWNVRENVGNFGGKTNRVHKPEEDQVIVPGGCPKIIDEDLFNDVQNILHNRKGGKSAKGRRHYMLSGLKVLKCAECGSDMVGCVRKSHGIEYMTYYCPKHKEDPKSCSMNEIKTKCIDRFVAKVLAYELTKRNDLGEVAKQLCDDNDFRKNLLNRKAGVEKTLANAVQALGTCYSEAIVQKIVEAEQEKKAIDEALVLENSKKDDITKDDVRNSAKKFAKLLLESDDPAVRTYLMKTIKEIVVGKDTVKFEFNVA